MRYDEAGGGNSYQRTARPGGFHDPYYHPPPVEGNTLSYICLYCRIEDGLAETCHKQGNQHNAIEWQKTGNQHSSRQQPHTRQQHTSVSPFISGRSEQGTQYA